MHATETTSTSAGAQSAGRRYFPRFYRGNLSRRRHSEPKTKREREKAGEDTLLCRRPIITSSCTNVAMPRRYRGKRKRASRRRLFIRSSRFIFPHDAMHYTSPDIFASLPPSPTLRHPTPTPAYYFCFTSSIAQLRALHREMRARRPFTVYRAVTGVIHGNSGETMPTLRQPSFSANPRLL